MSKYIPNLNTPADLFDRLIIERLKVEKLKESGGPPTGSLSAAEECVRSLKVEISKLIVESNGDMSELVDTFDHLVVSVSTVSFCENTKAELHKISPKPVNSIAELDRISRKANEDRALFKRSINNLFEKISGQVSIPEARTF